MAEAETPPVATILFKKRAPKSSTSRKRPATPPPASPSSSDFSESEDESGRIIKRRKITGVQASTATNSTAPSDLDDLKASTQAADASTSLSKSDDATKQPHWFVEDARAQNPLRAQSRMNAQASKSIGPQKASANVRTITVTDFAPDVCKDYKKTGFCGFGDSCKFLHAREDYKQGWQLDKDWETAGNSSKNNAKKGGGTVTASLASKKAATLAEGDLGGKSEEKVDELLEGIPFACVICKENYKFPIVTQCGHYLCEKCALKRYKKDPSCAVCGAGTGGVFSGAKTLKRLLEKKRERVRQKKEEARQRGEEVSEDEGEGT